MSPARRSRRPSRRPPRFPDAGTELIAILRSQVRISQRFIEPQLVSFLRTLENTSTENAYAASLFALYPICATLETALLNDRDLAFLRPYFQAPALLADLRALDRPPGRDVPEIAADYFAKVQAVADTAPHLLAAHAYVRYALDLPSATLAAPCRKRHENGGIGLSFAAQTSGCDRAALDRSFAAYFETQRFERETRSAFVHEVIDALAATHKLTPRPVSEVSANRAA